jgi:hypothetical protein
MQMGRPFSSSNIEAMYSPMIPREGRLALPRNVPTRIVEARSAAIVLFKNGSTKTVNKERANP